MAAKKSVRQGDREADMNNLRKVGEYLGGKGTTGSADSRERQSRARRANLVRGVYADVEERRAASVAAARKKPVAGPAVPKSKSKGSRPWDNTKPRYGKNA